MTRLEKLEAFANDLGYTVRTWSPGDGVTRYRIFPLSWTTQTYNGPANSPFRTQLGYAAAMRELRRIEDAQYESRKNGDASTLLV